MEIYEVVEKRINTLTQVRKEYEELLKNPDNEDYQIEIFKSTVIACTERIDELLYVLQLLED